ncbi:MAG: bifunctional 2-C-methyl-D-erythritol 4-phosphate cytidylyltransferase/2-C-methyl-D-erythritol 2,4-cyclodiphosphate synthase [Ancalomicrobiaceae bacterium]|nr:bifunctional 2-C-methyl-D-erythritol 4-phosphate cytidylyltransferase/2-C-methyl-D-erythritol 2,4-cyclodiphosphate synthase [Ancalomicrobiaceae bacterium]
MPQSPLQSPTVAVIVVAAGSGSRAGEPDSLPKQYRPIGGRPMLAATLDLFLSDPAIAVVVPVIHGDHIDTYRAATVGLHPNAARLHEAVIGGSTRQASVLAGLQALAGDPPDLVLIHDAARPFLKRETVAATIAALAKCPAVLVASPVVDTLKRADAAGAVADTVPRHGLWAAQTPQGFDFAAILAAHRRAATEGRADFTDDAAVAEWAGITVRLVAGPADNVKVTTAQDLASADRKMWMQTFAALADIRVGTGYDVHAFTTGDHVTLCGVKIAHSHALSGHSDADVALHALTDALLGTIGDGDIGQHFPPSDNRWRGADSALFVRDAARRIQARGGQIAHVDISIIAEAPKIGPHREAMRARVAEILGLSIDRVGLKATTNEKLGFVGRREGLAAIATATVRLPLPSDQDITP